MNEATDSALLPTPTIASHICISTIQGGFLWRPIAASGVGAGACARGQHAGSHSQGRGRSPLDGIAPPCSHLPAPGRHGSHQRSVRPLPPPPATHRAACALPGSEAQHCPACHQPNARSGTSPVLLVLHRQRRSFCVIGMLCVIYHSAGVRCSRLVQAGADVKNESVTRSVAVKGRLLYYEQAFCSVGDAIVCFVA